MLSDAETQKLWQDARLAALAEKPKLPEMMTALDELVALEKQSLLAAAKLTMSEGLSAERVRQIVALEKLLDFLRLVEKNEASVVRLLRQQ